VMSQFLNLLGASSACVDFCDPTDFYRFNRTIIRKIISIGTSHPSNIFYLAGRYKI